MSAPAVVVDTSVHLSAIHFAKAPSSPAKEVIVRGFDDHFRFAVSGKLLEELARKLATIGADVELAARYLALLIGKATTHPEGATEGVNCRDPNDVFIVALARSCAAWCVVAQDGDLVDDDGAPPGWTPPRFLARLREHRGEPTGSRWSSATAKDVLGDS